jgi:hypothetical protein
LAVPIPSALFAHRLPSLPLAALQIFLIIIPIIITIMNKWSGMVSVTQVDLGLISRYFIFQVSQSGMGATPCWHHPGLNMSAGSLLALCMP